MTKRSGFQFKQFQIFHDRCAMKVGTDSIMLGSWAHPEGAGRILDIGTGSGLLAIMQAQKSSADTRIVGIDLDDAAVEQAMENAALSPWAAQIEIQHTSLQAFRSDDNFDVVISNPPYYSVNAKAIKEAAINQQRQQARLTGSLDLEDLVKNALRLLSDKGRIFLVLPVEQHQNLRMLVREYGLHINRQLMVKARPDSEVIRGLFCLSAEAGQAPLETLTIYARQTEYSDAYKLLCRDYYLNF